MFNTVVVVKMATTCPIFETWLLRGVAIPVAVAFGSAVVSNLVISYEAVYSLTG